jgi:polygalacturonase
MNHKTIHNLFLISFLTILLTIKICKSEGTFDVTKYGADIKAVSKSTAAINNAIAEAAKSGGGTVYFPAGKYLTGPIHFKSNITLHLEDNVVITFSTDYDDYLPMVKSRWEGTQLINFSPLIYANGVENIAIRGHGILDGQGKSWWDEWRKLQNQYKQNKTRDTKWQKEFLRLNNVTELVSLLYDDHSNDHRDKVLHINTAFLRPPFIHPINSKNIVIQDVTVRNCPFWNINPVYCENITITGVKIEAPAGSPNTDGLDPDSCKNVFISNVKFTVSDDCIAIKSGIDLQGRQIGKPTENVVIKNCTMTRGHGGVAIGSEMSGGVRNVTVTDCRFDDTQYGIYIKSKRGRGGVVEDIHISDITMKNIHDTGIFLDTFYTNTFSHVNQTEITTHVPFTESTPVFRNININRVSGSASQSTIIQGLSESLIENVTLENINIAAKRGLDAIHVKNLKLNQFTHNSP